MYKWGHRGNLSGWLAEKLVKFFGLLLEFNWRELIFSLNFDEFSVWIERQYQIWIFDMALKAYKAVYIFSPVT